ncbi:MAG: ATP-binding protein [Leptolyngbyaceae bacterium]|nr:ATP-binding protein [Leptolyngbyaceae bacterium]
MPIKITPATEAIRVEAICLTIYSQPGLGKTSLAFTASNPLLLDFDKGAYRAVDRRDVVQVSDWRDVADIEAKDVAGYDTIVIDTVGKALDCLSQDIMRANSRLGYAGALNQQGWGQLGVRFGAFLRKLKAMGKDIVLVAHMDEQRDSDSIKERLKISGGSKDLVLTDSDAIARITVVNKERHLIFSPTETSFGKDPAGIDFMPIPMAGTRDYPDTLARVISRIKEGLNALSEEQVARKSEVEWFKANLPEMKSPDDINMVLGRAKKAGRDVAMMVVKRADELGLHFDERSHSYVWLEQMGERMNEEAAAAEAENGEAA